MILSAFKNMFKWNKYHGIKSFTYFIPSPPFRKTGYQEKEFDQIFAHLMQLGFDILSIKMQSLNQPQSSGVWILCVLGAKTKIAFETPIDIDYQTVSSEALTKSNIQLDPLIEHDC